jgi:hypothetical protein
MLYNMAKVYDLKTGQRKEVNRMEFIGLLNTVEEYIKQLRPFRFKQDGLNKALEIVNEIKFNGSYNPKFRDEITVPLEDLLDDMYIELHRK